MEIGKLKQMHASFALLKNIFFFFFHKFFESSVFSLISSLDIHFTKITIVFRFIIIIILKIRVVLEIIEHTRDIGTFKFLPITDRPTL